MYPILFKLGKFNIYTHGLFAVAGITAGIFLVHYVAKKKGLKSDFLIDDLIISILIGIIVSKLTYFLLYRDQFQSFKELFYLWQGGLVSYGGFIAGGIAFYFLLTIQKLPALKWLDFASLGFLLGVAIGRVGDYLSGDYNGVIVNKNGAIYQAPIPLYESMLCFSALALLLFLFNFLYNRYQSGMIFTSAVILYAAGRFVIDFWRAEEKLAFNLSIGQIVSILVLAFVLVRLKLAAPNEKGERDELSRQIS